MHDLKPQLISIQTLLIDLFNNSGSEVIETELNHFNYNNWINRVWTSNLYRRAHLNIIDASSQNGLWMLHCCIFPHIHNPAPIFGFDIVAGRNKITGCFHDFSPAGDNEHDLIKWFESTVSDLQWTKIRDLPEWGKRIFSPAIIAASNIQTNAEIAQIVNTVNITSKHYLSQVAATNNTAKTATITAQNYYAQCQKENPRTPKVIASLGLNDQEVDIFIQQYLFPELS